ncbi:unnamed protein product [Rhizoctonia solani]|uniref:Uncharacterized protein n=1 Tax=Rhizoctonia solani TaxID=456999 RepID=A0A8H2X639_9AGAM|nr:unnamed protein product [Rhizoctonia solani]
MRPSTPAAALVTLMSVVSTAAAPIQVDLGHAISRVGNHPRPLGRSAFPVSDSKLPKLAYPNTCECMPVDTEDAKSTAIGIESKAEDAYKAVQDETHVPDAHTHVEIDTTKGGDNTTEPQPQPQPQSQQPADEPKDHTGDCLDLTELQTCVTTNIKDGIDVIHHDVYMSRDNVKAMAGTALDRVPNIDDKSMNAVYVVENAAHIMPDDNVNIGSDAPKLAGEPCEPTTAKAIVEGVNPIKGIYINCVANPSI